MPVQAFVTKSQQEQNLCWCSCVCLADLQSADPGWYNIITSQLTPEQTKQLEDVFKLAEQRKAAAGSWQIL